MAAIAVTASKIRPLSGAIIRRFQAASTSVTVGSVVYVKSDGKIELADADDVTACQARGIVVAIGASGKTTAAVGDMCDVVTHGPVELGNGTAMTIGAPVYVDTTAGSMDQTASAAAGDYNYICGYAMSGTELYFQGQMIIPTVTS